MYILPQETTALAPYEHNKVTDAITVALSAKDGAIAPLMLEDGYPVPNCYIVTPKCKNVPVFHVPLRVATSVTQLGKVDSTDDFCVDMRAHMRETRTGVTISNPTEYGFNADMVQLLSLWSRGEFRIINNFCQEPLMRCWVRWLGTALITRLNILETSQPNVNIITAWYFYCLLTPDEDTIPAHKFTRIATVIGKATYANPTNIVELISKLPHITRIEQYIEVLKEHAGTDRVNNLTPGFIFSLLQYSWYGSSAIQVVSAALECPPLFVAMCWGSLRYDAYRRTPIGKTMKDMKTADNQVVMQTIEKLLAH